jgi:outer membrane protein assembly factor BamD
MNSSNILRGFTAISLLLMLSGCSTSKDPADEFKNQSAEQIYQGGEQAISGKNYSTAVKHFEALDSLYPFNSNQEKAMIDSIFAYYQSGDYASSSAAAARFLHDYPASQHADYALYMKGSAEMIQDRSWPQRYLPVDVSSRDPGMAKAAFKDFSDLVNLFPNSTYAPDARARMVYLRNIFAKKEVDIAEFYYNKKAYVASANRAATVLAHYNGTPATEKALYLMVKSYRELGQTTEANKALETLKLTFPKSAYLRKL